MRFTRAIVRTPSASMVDGLTSATLGVPDFKQALIQHQAYIQALETCGLAVTVLEADENYPDSTFIEDTALLTPHCAIMTNPGALSRRGEVATVEPVMREFYAKVEQIRAPGTVEAGDIMMVGDHFYIGLSSRTNNAGAQQLIDLLNQYEMTGSVVNMGEMLHLKTGVSYLENNNLLVCGECLNNPEFAPFNLVIVPDSESYAANSVWINGTVITPSGYPKTRQRIADLGYSIIELEMSEFQKLDGGLSCLSLRF